MNIRIKNYQTSWIYRFRIRETILWFMNLLFSWRSGVSVSSALKVVLMKNANQMVIFIFIFRIKMSTLKKSTDVINVALFQKLFWTTVRNNFLVIYKNLSKYANTRLKTENSQIVWNKNTLFEQWKFKTIFEAEYFFYMLLEQFIIRM